MSDKLQSEPEPAEFLIYQTEDGQTRLEVTFRGETCWLSLNQLAELFQRDKSVISRHISNIYSEGELARGSVVANYATTAADGKNYHVEYYNLDVIISVGYRVKSHRSTQFRIWATQHLREFIINGFAMDDERLKRAGGRSRVSTRGCGKGKYGAHPLDRKPAEQKRSPYCQELFDVGRARHAQSHRQRLSGICRTSGPQP